MRKINNRGAGSAPAPFWKGEKMRQNQVLQNRIQEVFGDLAIHHVAAEIGVTAPTMSKALASFEDLNLRSAKKISDALGLSIDGILSGEADVGRMPCACPHCYNVEGVTIKGSVSPIETSWFMHCPACGRVAHFESRPR